MSSSEKAKTPASFEERNPFDISRNSGPEVAAEIAKRMAAWKTARARTYAAPTTIPGPEAKQAPIAAPVQPARVPKASAYHAAPARTSGAATPSVPYFASASATRRAMPAAPSLKQPSSDQAQTVAAEPVTPTAAPIPAQEPSPEAAAPTDLAPALVPAPAEAAPIATEAPVADPMPVEDSPFGAVADASADQAEPNAAIEAPGVDLGQGAEATRIRDEARAIRARWIAAHDFDSIAEAEAKAVAAPAVGTAPVADVEGAFDQHETRDDEPPENADAGELASRPEPEADLVLETAGDGNEAPTPIETGDEAVSVSAPDETADGKQPTSFAEPLAAASEETPDPAISEPELRNDHVAGISTAALDEIAGRREPTFDSPELAARDEPVEQPRSPEAAPEPEAADFSIAALDEMAGRKEPTFDRPVRQIAPSNEADARSSEKQAAVELPRLEAAPVDRAIRISEPTPAVEPKTAAPIVVPRIKVRPIETRIEARRIETLRAEPELSAGRPILSQDEAEEWDLPSALAAKAHRARRGTGWAIGLGSVLLIAGITAPAAIWQQGRQDQDRVAVVTPAPQTTASAPAAAATVPTVAPATLPEAPQVEVANAAPAPEPVDGDFATVLKKIGDGVEVEPAPVMTPPPPAETLASASPAANGTFMVARPFVADTNEGPFLRAPSGMTPVSPAGAKPGLIVQLKPKVTAVAAKPAVSKAKPVARQPKPFFKQSPDQMFDTLIDTLSNGKPANPATKPQSPSTRR